MSATVAEVRAVLGRARERLGAHGQRTILFLDEIHRFNKAQQDALLPAVEEGLVTLIGATTENPYFEVNSALMSRMQLYTLEPLTDEEVAVVVRRGAAVLDVAVPDELALLIARSAGGDARSALNILELAAQTADAEGTTLSRGARRRRRPQAPARLRPLGRPALRLHVRLHQVDARLRPGRGRLLPRRDARGGRGPPLRRAAHGHPRLRGRGRRRPAGARRRGRRRAGARARRAPGSEAQPDAGCDLPRLRAEVERRHARALGRDPRRARARQPASRRRSSATPTTGGRRSSATARGTSIRTTTRPASRSTTCRTS